MSGVAELFLITNTEIGLAGIHSVMVAVLMEHICIHTIPRTVLALTVSYLDSAQLTLL